MCTTCGCGGAGILLPVPEGAPVVLRSWSHRHAEVVGRNVPRADRNRAWLEANGVHAVNLMSSPGAGKTTLLVHTLWDLHRPAVVIEGDQATEHDAIRIRETGTPAVQVNTGTGCHLDADLVWRGIETLAPPPGTTLFVENVGNLVCPALFDLGEAARVVLLSVTEGEDKPLKYPEMFGVADLVVLTKLDLAPHVGFDADAARAAIDEVRPGIEVIALSAHTRENVGAWLDWLRTAGGP